MGSANSTIPAEPLIAAVAVVGVLGYGYAHYLQPARARGSTDTDASFLGLSKGGSTVLHRQKKRGRKLQLPGDATLKNLDFLDSSVPPATTATTTPPPRLQTASRSQGGGSGGDVVPGGFGSPDNTSNDAHRSLQQQQQPEQDVKKPRKKRGKKIVSDLAPADAGGVAPGKTEKTQVSAPPAVAMADASDERWTRVEARKKKVVPPQNELSKLQTSMDATTSDAGITTSVTGNSSPVTERTTEDELPSGLDECVLLAFF